MRFCISLIAVLVYAGVVSGLDGMPIAQTDTSKPPAEIHFGKMRAGRPPLNYLTFDVTLRNDRKSARWFLLPSNLGPGKPSIGVGGVNALEVFVPRGQGSVIVGRFLGTGGFQAILLPPNAEVRLRQFPISYWGDPPQSVEIEVVVAKNLMIGDETAESWFGPIATSSVKADISEEAEAAKRIAKSRRTTDNKEVASVIEVESKLKLQVALEN